MIKRFDEPYLWIVAAKPRLERTTRFLTAAVDELPDHFWQKFRGLMNVEIKSHAWNITVVHLRVDSNLLVFIGPFEQFDPSSLVSEIIRMTFSRFRPILPRSRSHGTLARHVSCRDLN